MGRLPSSPRCCGRFHGSQRLLHHDQGLRAICGGDGLGDLRGHGVRPQVVGQRTVGRTVGCRVTHPVSVPARKFPQPSPRKSAVPWRNYVGDSAVAVRSSAPGEDSRHVSFAGLHESIVGVQGGRAVLDAVRTVWASLWSDAALALSSRAGVGPAAKPDGGARPRNETC